MPYDSGETVLVSLKKLSASDNSAVEDTTFSYYAENKKVGVMTGSLYEVIIYVRYPGTNLYQFNNQPDMGAALDAGVIDCFTVPRAAAEDFVQQYSSMTCLKIDIVTRFCQEYGYALNISTTEFAAIIPAVTSRVADIACVNIAKTTELAESVDFYDPYYTTDTLAVVCAESTEAEATPGFFESITTSFEKNFIREDRWQMIVDGIGTTCLNTA